MGVYDFVQEQVPIAQVVEIMKRKREIHEHVIAAATQQRAAAKAFEKVRLLTTHLVFVVEPEALLRSLLF